MEATRDYLTRYASQDQLDTVKDHEQAGWKVSHLFTLATGRWFVWMIAEPLETENKKGKYSHLWIARNGKAYRYPSHRR